jgi:RNA polymerase sigma factor (sigma-70 family)
MNRPPECQYPRLKPPHEAELWRRYLDSARTDLAVRNRLIEHHLPLSVWVVRRYLARFPHLERHREEFESFATVRLIGAVENFDPTRGKFSTYGVWAIEYGMDLAIAEVDPTHAAERRERMRQRAAQRRRVPCTARATPGTFPLPSNFEVEERPELLSLDEQLDLERLRELLATMKDGSLLWRYYVDGQVMVELAAELGISKQRIHQRLAEARRRARKLLAAAGKHPDSRCKIPPSCSS